MRVAVCCKGVPSETLFESVHVVDGDIQFRDTEFYINEFDAYALEAAIGLKSSNKAETVALTVGPLRAQEVLYIALAKGIDQVLRIEGETSVPDLIARGLVSPLRELKPDLVLVGVQSEDWMGGEVGIYVAEALDMGLAYAVVDISELSDTDVRVLKEIGGGRKAEMRLKLPAVLCVQSGIRPLRYVSAMKRQKVRNTPIKLWGKIAKDVAAPFAIKDVSLPSREGQAEMITGERPEKARKLLEIISKAV
jgi:electron transfer flavoprotein beta subunit